MTYTTKQLLLMLIFVCNFIDSFSLISTTLTHFFLITGMVQDQVPTLFGQGPQREQTF